MNTNPEHKTQTQNTEDRNTCPENLPTCADYPLAQKIYSKHMPRKLKKKNPDPDPGLVEPMQYSLCLVDTLGL